MNPGKKITIYLTNGLPKGVREVKVDQWNGKAICGPRNALAEIVSLPEIDGVACIYFLVGIPDEGGLLNVYVGEADGFKERIRQHDYKKDWWQEVVAFISSDRSLTKTSVQYLESICVERLHKAGKCNLKNNNNPSIPSILKEDISGLEIFYENLITIMPLLGYDIFVPKETFSAISKSDDVMFVCKKGSDVVAHAHLLADGTMKVLKGSKASLTETSSFQNHAYKKLRDELIKLGRLVQQDKTLLFNEDYVFDSASAASAVIQARSSQGPIEWKILHSSTTLKDYLNASLS